MFNWLKKNPVKIILVLFLLLLPLTSLAQNDVQQGMSGLQPLFPQRGIGGSDSLTGPGGLIFNIISILLGIAGAVAVVFVIIGGFQYMTAAGNEEQAESGRKTLINAIIGTIIIIMAYVIINVIVNLANGGY